MQKHNFWYAILCFTIIAGLAGFAVLAEHEAVKAPAAATVALGSATATSASVMTIALVRDPAWVLAWCEGSPKEPATECVTRILGEMDPNQAAGAKVVAVTQTFNGFGMHTSYQVWYRR
jgi:hypothetical protein